MSRYIFLMVLFSFLQPFASLADLGKPPVLIEFYGKPLCGQTPQAQKDLKEIMAKHDNIVLLNCFSYSSTENKNFKMERSYCGDHAGKYAKALDMYPSSPFIVINGRWVASNQDITPAVNLGRLDKVTPISIELSKDGHALDISFPKIKGKPRGAAFLYSYMPSENYYKQEAIVDPNISVTDEIKEKLSKGQSVPFVTKEKEEELFYLRPLLDKKPIGSWHGEALQMQIPINNIAPLSGNIRPNLSYIVVVHEENEFGKVLAVGEKISEREKIGILPKSTPIEIKRISKPNENL